MFKLLNGTAVDLLSYCVVEAGWSALSGNSCDIRLAIRNKYGGLLLSSEVGVKVMRRQVGFST